MKNRKINSNILLVIPLYILVLGLLILNIPIVSGQSINDLLVHFDQSGGDSWINTGGNVGIGTTSPTHVLDVAGSTSIARFGDASGSAGIAINGAAGTVRDLSFQSDSISRWIIRTGSTAETGNNAGSDFMIVRRSDSGGILGSRFTITRSNGQVCIGNC